jgi:hypothetical protein
MAQPGGQAPQQERLSTQLIGGERGYPRDRFRHPGRRIRDRSLGRGIEQGSEHAQGCDPVADDMMQPDQQPAAASGEPGQQPHLPQRTRQVQRILVQLCASSHQCCLIARLGDRPGTDMPPDVEILIIDPDGRTQARPRPVQYLAQPGSQVQPPFDDRPQHVQARLARRGGQRAPVEDDQRGDVHRHAAFLNPQVAHVQRAEPVQMSSRHACLLNPWASRVTNE